nr:MAG TPA: hypothetical protein [Caudoviricetes sp.]
MDSDNGLKILASPWGGCKRLECKVLYCRSV